MESRDKKILDDLELDFETWEIVLFFFIIGLVIVIGLFTFYLIIARSIEEKITVVNNSFLNPTKEVYKYKDRVEGCRLKYDMDRNYPPHTIGDFFGYRNCLITNSGSRRLDSYANREIRG